jgi:hypothetical protein
VILGYAFIIAGIFYWVAGIYAVVASKIFMPLTGHYVLDWMSQDKYYCALLPSWLVIIVLLSWVNWLAMKYFRHG